jgi:hypothetical protein
LLATAAVAVATAAVAFPSAAAATTTTFFATADTYVQDTSPSTNFGTATQLKVDSSPVLRTFLKFTVSGLPTEPVTSATLRIHTANTNKASSSVGGIFGSVSDTTWSETAMTWNNQPAIGATLGTLGSVSRNTWYQIDVTSAITGNGTYSIGATSTSTNDAIYDSRETGANAPQLVVTTGVQSNDPVLVGAGDIASCSSTGDEATANLLDGISGTVFTAGDNVYENGTTTEFNNCYDPTWGRRKARTKPSAGNHDYNTAGATGYYGYFGAAAGDPTKGYYSYDIGSWHVVVINSNCSAIGGCQAGSAQEQWLRQDLAASAQPCTISYWHHPRFTSGSNHAPATEMTPIWQALYDFNADVVVSGHNHQYERFAPQTANGTLDTVRGIREFVVGTGGRSHYTFGTIQPNSEVRNSDTYGVIKLTLHANGYDWQFVPEAGKTFTDSGSNTCH